MILEEEPESEESKTMYKFARGLMDECRNIKSSDRCEFAYKFAKCALHVLETNDTIKNHLLVNEFEAGN